MADSGKGRTALYLFLLWVIYLIVGVLIFRAVEHDDNKKPEKTKEQLLETLKDDVTAKYNMSEAEFNSIVQQIEAASSSNAGPEWSYPESLSFVIQLITTIGKQIISENASYCQTQKTVDTGNISGIGYCVERKNFTNAL